jgi:hypothetical protein
MEAYLLFIQQLTLVFFLELLIIYRNIMLEFFQVMDFVSRYLPAYHAYLPKLYKEGPNGSKPDHLLVIDIDEGRNPICG